MPKFDMIRKDPNFPDYISNGTSIEKTNSDGDTLRYDFSVQNEYNSY